MTHFVIVFRLTTLATQRAILTRDNFTFPLAAFRCSDNCFSAQSIDDDLTKAENDVKSWALEVRNA
jgi:hypothetical protein